MHLHEFTPNAGSTHYKKRVGRGRSSGHGKTSTRGHKGQKSRSGGGVRIGFEGGQMPLARRVPKRGFNNIFAKPLVAINVGQLRRFPDGSTVGEEELIESGILSKTSKYGVKILGEGAVPNKLTVRAAAFSESARQKIEAAGGKAEVV